MNKLYEESDIQAIANAIRAKGVSGQMTVAQMAGKVGQISTGGIIPSGTLTHTVTGSEDIYCYSYAYVHVDVLYYGALTDGTILVTDTNPVAVLATLQSMGYYSSLIGQIGTVFLCRA